MRRCGRWRSDDARRPESQQPVSKHRTSASFVLVSLGLSALVFYGFHCLNARTWLRPSHFMPDLPLRQRPGGEDGRQ